MITYRKANHADVKNLVTLTIQVWLETYAIEGVRTSFSEYLLDNFNVKNYQSLLDAKHITTIIAAQNGYLLGYIMLDANSHHKTADNGFEISRLYVSSHFKGRGIGKQLLNEMKKQCGSTCWLAAYIGNKPAINFYLHQGFKDIDEAIFILDDERVENRILSLT